MNFLGWYGIGVATIVLTLLIEAYRHGCKEMRIRRAFSELYDILIRKADVLSTVLLGLVALGGPLLIVAIIYFVTRNWVDSLAVDEDGNRDFPWTKD